MFYFGFLLKSWKPCKWLTLMGECRYFRYSEETTFFFQQHWNVFKHHDEFDQPILMKDLQIRIFKKLNNAMFHNVLLIDDSPYRTLFIIEIKKSILPLTTWVLFWWQFYPCPLFKWLQFLVVSNIHVRNFAKNNPIQNNFLQHHKLQYCLKTLSHNLNTRNQRLWCVVDKVCM